MYRELYENLLTGCRSLLAREDNAGTDVHIPTVTNLIAYALYNVGRATYWFDDVVSLDTLCVMNCFNIVIHFPKLNIASFPNGAFRYCNTNVTLYFPLMTHQVIEATDATCYWSDGIYKGDGTYIGPLPDDE